MLLPARRSRAETARRCQRQGPAPGVALWGCLARPGDELSLRVLVVVAALVPGEVRLRAVTRQGAGADRGAVLHAVVRLRTSQREALARLAKLDLRKSQIIEMRYFGGMSVEETAEFLGVSPITIKREWMKARAWLYRELDKGSDPQEDARPAQE